MAVMDDCGALFSVIMPAQDVQVNIDRLRAELQPGAPGMASKKAAASKPPKFKPPPVVCQSLDDADGIFADWQDLDLKEARAKADCTAAQNAAKEKFKAALFVVFPDGSVSFADRREQFESAIEAYAVKHRDDILIDKLKSRELNYGVIGWKVSPDSIGVPEGRPDDGNQAILESLLHHVRGSLEKFKEVPANLLECLKVEVNWSREALAKALTDGKITKEDLRSIGFKHVEGEDEVFVKPHKPKLASLETGTPK